MSDKPILKVAVTADGAISIDGAHATIDSLREAFAALAAQKGAVWYYRENGAGEPPPQAMQVMEAIVQNRLPVRLSTKPDYSDAVGPDGKPIAASGQDAVEAALARAYADPSERDGFYRALLANPLFFLTPQPPPGGSGVTKEETNLPIVRLEGPQGPIIPVFSSGAQAQAFAQGKAHVIGLPGSTAVKVLAGTGMPAVLNPGAAQPKVLATEEIRGLLPMLGKEEKIAKGTEYRIGQPAERPVTLIVALREVFAGYPNVAEASLALIQVPSSGEPPHFLVGVRGENVQEAVAAAGAAARDKCGVKLLDFMPLADGKDGITQYFKTVEPFYRRAAQ